MDDAQALQPLISATHEHVSGTPNHSFPPSLPRFSTPQSLPAAGTRLDAFAPDQPEIEAMSTAEALRMYAPKETVRDKMIADFNKGLSPEDIATKHGVARGTAQAVIKRCQQACQQREMQTLSKSTQYRRKKKLEAEEAAEKESQPAQPVSCGESDFIRMKNQGACVACTVKFQKVALGKLDKSMANNKRARTTHGCKNCKVHLCRRGYCWDIFHKHAQA